LFKVYEGIYSGYANFDEGLYGRCTREKCIG